MIHSPKTHVERGSSITAQRSICCRKGGELLLKSNSLFNILLTIPRRNKEQKKHENGKFISYKCSQHVNKNTSRVRESE